MYETNEDQASPRIKQLSIFLENRQGALPLYWRQDGVLHVPRVVAGLVGFPLCLLAASLVIWGVIEWVTS